MNYKMFLVLFLVEKSPISHSLRGRMLSSTIFIMINNTTTTTAPTQISLHIPPPSPLIHNPKNQIHILQLHILRLGHKEGVKRPDNIHRPIHDPNLPPDIHNHDRRLPRHDEVHAPDHHQTARHAVVADTGWKDLAYVEPGDGTVGPAVGPDEEVDESHHAAAGGGIVRAGMGRVGGEGGGQAEHEDCHDDVAGEEDPFAAEMGDAEDDEDDCRDEFDDGDHAGGKERGVLCYKPDLSKDCGSVVQYGVMSLFDLGESGLIL